MFTPASQMSECSKPQAGKAGDIYSSEDEAIEVHSLSRSGLHQDYECPTKTADQAIQEIYDMMHDTSSEGDALESNEALEKERGEQSQPLYESKLRTLSVSQLKEIVAEREVLLREVSETLISELTSRDELEYEKELKDTFILCSLSCAQQAAAFTH